MIRNLTLYRLPRIGTPIEIARATKTSLDNSEFVTEALARHWRCAPWQVDTTGVRDGHLIGPHTFEAVNLFDHHGEFRLWMEKAE